jgi:predicted acyltransferase
MLAMGVVGLAAGKFFNLWFPINKKLWTSSYVVFAGGFALVCLALCYWLLDARQKRGRWTVPAIVFGANAIVAYTFSEMLASTLESLHVQLASGGMLNWQEIIYQRVFAPLASPPNASLLYSLTYVLVCWLFAWLLYRNRTFIKV